MVEPISPTELAKKLRELPPREVIDRFKAASGMRPAKPGPNGECTCSSSPPGFVDANDGTRCGYCTGKLNIEAEEESLLAAHERLALTLLQLIELPPKEHEKFFEDAAD